MRERLSLSAGREAFGDDPAAYHAARPDYPDALYAELARRAGAGPGTRAFEIGPGTGIVTRRLLGSGVDPLTAIEPDPRLAAWLGTAVPNPALTIRNTTFEDADLEPGGFDLGVAATSFHWLEQASALAKVREALRPSGWWAMWWTHFGGDKDKDGFQRATDPLFAATPAVPSHGRTGGPPFALDREARLADLAAAGLEAAEAWSCRWTLTLPTRRLVALYATFSPVRALAPDARAAFFADLARIADEDFGGAVERPFTAILYTARRPR
jgi:SAM-dependent methyltransferase